MFLMSPWVPPLPSERSLNSGRRTLQLSLFFGHLVDDGFDHDTFLLALETLLFTLLPPPCLLLPV
jgi:hypothetical protein